MDMKQYVSNKDHNFDRRKEIAVHLKFKLIRLVRLGVQNFTDKYR